MYDTLHLWLPAESIVDADFIRKIESRLINVTMHSKKDGTCYLTDKILGMSCLISDKGISLKGSICKSYFNNNLQTLTRLETKKAVENLEDALHLSFQDAKIGRIDFAHNLSMDYEPEIYYPYLGLCKLYKRDSINNTIYYNGRTRTKVFYNKISEVKNSKQKISKAFLYANLLRFELRFKSRLSNQFNMAKVVAKDLYNETFFKEMVYRWANEYHKINKVGNFNFDLKNMKQPKDFFSQLLSQKLFELGQPKLLEMVNELKARKSFEHPEYYSRLKKDIEKLLSPNAQTQTSKLILELDKKIDEAKQMFL
jgi:hypothetical protein